ncbi:hypothetical protein MD484_g4685, partial [Candolleomyces efflorescens]
MRPPSPHDVPSTLALSPPSSRPNSPFLVRDDRNANSCGGIISDMANSFWRAFLICAMIVGVSLFMTICVIMALIFCSALGAILVVIGNAVLRRAGHSGYVDDKTAAAVGATGGTLATLCFGIFSFIFSKPRINGLSFEEPPVLIQLVSSVVIGTLSGTFGSLVLLHGHVDLHGLDVLHATRAGAVGGAIMTLAALVVIPIIFATFVCILPMMVITLMASIEWLQAKYDEDWDAFSSRPIQLPVDDVEGGVEPHNATATDRLGQNAILSA